MKKTDINENRKYWVENSGKLQNTTKKIQIGKKIENG